MSYLLKPNPVTFTHMGEEMLSGNNHLYFSAETFPLGAQGQIQLFSVCGLKMYMGGISSMHVLQTTLNVTLWELIFKLHIFSAYVFCLITNHF